MCDKDKTSTNIKNVTKKDKTNKSKYGEKQL